MDNVNTKRMDKRASAKNKHNGPYSSKHVRRTEALLQQAAAKKKESNAFHK